MLLAVISFSASAIAQPGGFKTVGYASYYAAKFNGRKTSSGTPLNQKHFTCAHKTLPFGTRLRVVNLNNDRSIVVVVNDRGPFHKSRIIDLTKSAASELDFLRAGLAKVRIEILSAESKEDTVIDLTDSTRFFYKVAQLPKLNSGFTVKIGSYYSEETVFEKVRELKQQLDQDAFIQTLNLKNQTLYRVFAGNYNTREGAEAFLCRLSPSCPDAHVVELIGDRRKEEEFRVVPMTSTSVSRNTPY